MNSTTLLNEIGETYKQGRAEDLLAKMAAVWPDVGALASEEPIGDCCQMAMLAAFQLKQYDEGRIWKARALSRYARCGSMIGVGLMALTEAYIVGPEAALEIMEEVGVLFRAHDVETEFAFRVYHEKRGHFLRVLERYDEAAVEYDHALEYTKEDPRGAWKVKGGKALCVYQLALSKDGGDAAGIAEALVLTEAVRAGSRAAGFEEVARTAEANLRVMRESANDVIPYEIT